VCALHALQATILREDMASPSVIVVGDVVRGIRAASLPEASRELDGLSHVVSASAGPKRHLA
jgi:uroporphyrin-III C-methyltransferase